MKQIATKDDLQQLGTILSVWAHPDDESFSCGGLMAAAVKNGQRVVCITATKGEQGTKFATPEQRTHLAEVRSQEMKAAQAVLGISEHHWLDYNDGCCEQVNTAEAVAKIRRFIEDIQPDSILTFGPEGMTGHPDHAAVSRWVGLAVRQSSHKPIIYHSVELRSVYDKYLKAADEKLDIYFNIDQPPLRDEADCDICFGMSKPEQLAKRRALAAMPSQMSALLEYFDEQLFCEVFRCECFVKV